MMYRRNKLHAVKTTIDGITFASRKEANRYWELKLLQRAGKISDLEMQKKYVLIPAQYADAIEHTPKRGKEKKVKKLLERELAYYADFVYTKDGETIVEDTKGHKDGATYAVFVIKRKLMLYVHGIRIREV